MYCSLTLGTLLMAEPSGDTSEEEIFVDPSFGVRRTRSQLEDQLRIEGFPEEELGKFLSLMSPPQIFERMLKNLLFASKDNAESSTKWQSHFMALKQAERRYFAKPASSANEQ